MTEIRLPLSITYSTQGATPVAVVIEALAATEQIAQEAVSLLPSFVEGVTVQKAVLNVQSLSQQSPLREVFGLTLFMTFQDELKVEVPAFLTENLGYTPPEKYEDLVTVIFLVVVLYGADFAIAAAKRLLERNRPKEMLAGMIEELSSQTGRSEGDIFKILQSRFEKPSLVKKVAREAKRFLSPSQQEGAVDVIVGEHKISSDAIRQVPYVGEAEADKDFNKYTPMSDVDLEFHAMDLDKGKTGWAAVIPGVSDRRLKVTIMEPVVPAQIWGRESVNADVVVVSKLTSQGYEPFVVQVTAVND